MRYCEIIDDQDEVLIEEKPGQIPTLNQVRANYKTQKKINDQIADETVKSKERIAKLQAQKLD